MPIQQSIREHILRVIEEPFSRSRSPPERGGHAAHDPLLPLATQAGTPQPTAASSGGHAAVSPATTIHYPSPSGSLATTIPYPSPESLASTLPYSPPPEAAAAAAVKRGAEESPEEQSERKTARPSDSPPNQTGASAAVTVSHFYH